MNNARIDKKLDQNTKLNPLCCSSSKYYTIYCIVNFKKTVINEKWFRNSLSYLKIA